MSAFISLTSYLILIVLLQFPAAAFAGEAKKILVVGDSLSAGYGLARDESWVALLSERLREQGYDYEVVNASITGDTTRGGLARLPATLKRQQPAVVIIELGGNDGLRGLPVTEMRANLAGMIRAAREADARVLLLGMRIPPNYGPAYARNFAGTFAELAREFDVSSVPFFLDGVALDDEMMQGDGIHPNAKAQPRMLDNVWPTLEPLLSPGGCDRRSGKSLIQKAATG